MGTTLDHVSISKKANIYADGKCISYNLTFSDKTRKTIGVILPGPLTFGTDSAEIMEIVEGKCRVRVGREGDWKTVEGGHQFRVEGNSSFDIEVQETVHYVCHFVSQ